MTIVQIATGRQGAGSEIFALWLSRMLVRRGHCVFAAFHPASPLAQLCPAAVQTVPTPLRGTWDVASAGKLALLVRRQRVQLLHAHRARGGVYALVVSMLTKVPWVVTVHVPHGATRFRWASVILTVSRHAYRQLIAEGVAPERVRVIYAGVDPDDYAPTPERRARARQLLGADDGERLVGFVGRLTAGKGVDRLIALARRWRQRAVRFVLIGDGPLRSQVETIARSEQVPLHCLGFRPDVPLLLTGLDVYLHPSDYESFCLAALEAMAAGLPVIAGKVGGLPELVTPETGVLVDTADYLDALDEALRQLQRDPEYAQALGQAARQRVTEHFHWQRFADEHAAVYAEVMAAWRSAC